MSQANLRSAVYSVNFVPESGPLFDSSNSGEMIVQDPNAITIEMSVAVTPTNPPVIMGSTNLPDGTKLMVMLVGDPPACIPRCGLFYAPATVQNGRFTSSLSPPPIISGSYTIDIVTPMASSQPEMVRSVIGKRVSTFVVPML